MAKTSLSDPLRIDEVLIPGRGGRIGMTFCPGKKQPGGLTASWDRDLGLDLAAIEAWGAEALLSLIEEHEFARVGVSDMGSRMPEGMLHLWLPIEDYSVPGPDWEKTWLVEGVRLRSILRRGGRVLIHCMGGLGRTGSIAARLLVEFGLPPEEAISRVRAARPGAIESREQEDYVRAQAHLWAARERFRGCLLGGALGDALGATVEFLSLPEIRSRFGPGGLREPVDNAYGPAGRFTDDTQMSLFTAEALLSLDPALIEAVRAAGESSRFLEEAGAAFLLSFLNWLETQEGRGPRNRGGAASLTPESRGGEASTGAAPVGAQGLLLSRPELWARRAPGNTCLSALREARSVPDGSGKPVPSRRAANQSKGCGGVMRAAPAGLFAARLLAARAGGAPEPESLEASRALAFDLGAAQAELTHGHPSGFLPAGALALMVHELVLGASLPEAARRALSVLRSYPESGESVAALEAALELAAGRESDEVCVARLGEGWVGEEALAIGVFAALRAESLPDGLIRAANITGDSDSTASIAGNLLGAAKGTAGLPESWLGSLEARDLLEEVADDLFDYPDRPVLPSEGPGSDSPKARPEGSKEGRLAERAEAWWRARYPRRILAG